MVRQAKIWELWQLLAAFLVAGENLHLASGGNQKCDGRLTLEGRRLARLVLTVHAGDDRGEAGDVARRTLQMALEA